MNVIHQLFFSFFFKLYIYFSVLQVLLICLCPIQYAFCLISLALLPMITVAHTIMLIVIRVSDDDTIKALL